LSTRFGNEGQTQLFRIQLKHRAREKDESFPELAQAVRRLVRQAYLNASLAIQDVLVKEHLIDAITDAEMQWHVDSRPGTVQEALNIATELEAFQASERQRLRPGRMVTSAVGSQIAGKEGENVEPSVSKILQELKKRLFEELVKKITGPARLERGSTWRARSRGSQCWNCGYPGHFSRNYPRHL